jgi:hypothetical protein
MDIFSLLNANTMTVMQLLLDSSNFTKLIYYNDDKPLSHASTPTSSQLLFIKLYPYVRIPDVKEDQQTIVGVTFNNAKLNNSNKKTIDSQLRFYIISHINLWRIEGGLRPYSIASEIHTIFNELNNTKLTFGKVIFDTWDYVSWNDVFCGYVASYNLVGF